MSSNRLTRVNELLKREIAGAMFRVMDNAVDFDPGAVTVTHVVTNSDLRGARVFLSIRGDEFQREKMLKAIWKHRKDFQEVIAKNVVLKYNPHLHFAMDNSLREGDRVLGLIAELEKKNPSEPDDEFDWDEYDGDDD